MGQTLAFSCICAKGLKFLHIKQSKMLFCVASWSLAFDSKAFQRFS